MTIDPNRTDQGAYGKNVPTEEAKPDHGIRERTAESDANKRDNEEAFDETRRQAADQSDTHGGMGRVETPRDGETQGEWHQSDDVGADLPNI